MTREQADWLHRYRWIPWLVILIVLPLKLWPASFWFDIRTVQIGTVPAGQPIPMLVEREIKRPFYGRWHATIRQWDGAGWVTWCNAEGGANYKPEARYPKNLSLQWWTDGACHPLPTGRYKVTTSWTVQSPIMLSSPTTELDSNVFEVTP